MPFCAAINCSNRLKKGSGKTFHRFPRSKPALLKEWVVNMRRDCWSPRPYSSLCCDHFVGKCFDRTGQTTRLHPGAVPTLFNFPEHLRKNINHRKLPRPRSVIQPTSEDEAGCMKDTPNSTTPVNDITAGVPTHHTPTKMHQLHDHTYSINESPRSVKRKLDKMHDKVTSLQKRLKSSQTKSRRLCKKVNTLKSVVKTLKEKNLMPERGIEMLEKTCDVPSEIMKRLVRARHKDATSKEKYPPALRAFALTLNFYSAKAYRFVRKTFDLQLPHPSLIRKWYSTIEGQPCFTAESFTTLGMKVRQAKDSGHELVCGLMPDEMANKLVRHEMEGVCGNCTAQDQTSILHVSSAITTTADSHHEGDMLLTRKYDLSLRSPSSTDYDYCDIPNIIELSAYNNSAITYIAGYVVKMTKKCLSCEECAAALVTGEVMEGSFLEKKNRGGLVRPAPDVVKVCETTEKCIQRLLSVTGGNLPQAFGISHAISCAVVGEIGYRAVFDSLSEHMFDCEEDNNHVFYLIKSVAASYVKIRMHHLARQMNEKKSVDHLVKRN
uniref:uncharacterized protein n=1 Tax=Myxine glutinosa TaxID=7769 RepID=UPI00358E1433